MSFNLSNFIVFIIVCLSVCLSGPLSVCLLNCVSVCLFFGLFIRCLRTKLSHRFGIVFHPGWYGWRFFLSPVYKGILRYCKKLFKSFFCVQYSHTRHQNMNLNTSMCLSRPKMPILESCQGCTIPCRDLIGISIVS